MLSREQMEEAAVVHVWTVLIKEVELISAIANRSDHPSTLLYSSSNTQFSVSQHFRTLTLSVL